MHRTVLVALAAAALACDGAAAPKDVAERAPAAEAAGRRLVADRANTRATIGWPQDQAGHQLSNIDSLRLTIPECSDRTVAFSVDSVGPLHPGQTLRDVVARCPRSLPVWDWGDEGIPTPVLLARFGAMTVRISLADTLPASQVTSLLSADSSARTMEGIGPGSTVAALQLAYGRPTYQEGECVVYATIPSLPGMSFRLDLLKKYECGTLEGNSGKDWQAPPTTRVTEVFVYSR